MCPIFRLHKWNTKSHKASKPYAIHVFLGWCLYLFNQPGWKNLTCKSKMEADEREEWFCGWIPWHKKRTNIYHVYIQKRKCVRVSVFLSNKMDSFVSSVASTHRYLSSLIFFFHFPIHNEQTNSCKIHMCIVFLTLSPFFSFSPRCVHSRQHTEHRATAAPNTAAKTIYRLSQYIYTFTWANV